MKVFFVFSALLTLLVISGCMIVPPAPNTCSVMIVQRGNNVVATRNGPCGHSYYMQWGR